MSDVKVSSGPAIGFIGLLTIVLVVLKALGYITWSWWIVFLPMFASFGIFIIVWCGSLWTSFIFAKKIDKICARYSDDWQQDKRFK